MIVKIIFFIVIALFAAAMAYSPNMNEYIVGNRQQWKATNFVPWQQSRPQNLLTLRDFIHRRGYPVNNVVGEFNARIDDIVVKDEGKETLQEGTRASSEEYTSQSITPDDTTVLKTQNVATESNRLSNEVGPEENITLVEDSFRKHIVGDLVTGFTYVKGIFTDAITQADVIADKYLEFEEARRTLQGKNRSHRNVQSKEVGGFSRASTDLPMEYDLSDPICEHQRSKCYNRSSLGSRTDEDDTALEEARGKLKKKKKFLRKILLPLLLSYKLKFFALIPVLISGLVLLVGSTGLAGFFFALFAAVLSIKHSHSG